MDAATFKEFSSHEWHIGLVSVQTCFNVLRWMVN